MFYFKFWIVEVCGRFRIVLMGELYFIIVKFFIYKFWLWEVLLLLYCGVGWEEKYFKDNMGLGFIDSKGYYKDFSNFLVCCNWF